MLRVLTVIGTRPEAIKMAPVIRELQRYPDCVALSVCNTAQHREMLDQVLNLFDIHADHDLNVMSPNQTLAGSTASIIAGVDSVLQQENPDWVLVQGDTTTVMATALAAFFRQVRVGHVEAGLRTGDKRQPFPEEINRRVASVVADRHFAPTWMARENLLRENIAPDDILVTGNPVIDALLEMASREEVMRSTLAASPDLSRLDPAKRLILVTAHRRENFGDPIRNICRAIREIAEQYPDVQFVYPVHLNPMIGGPVREMLNSLRNVFLVDPVDYATIVALMQRSWFVVTDSGGIQEEAPSLGKPVLVLREVTERPEAVQAGTVQLVGTDPEVVIAWMRRLLDDSAAYRQFARSVNPYGDGMAAHRIVQSLLRPINEVAAFHPLRSE